MTKAEFERQVKANKDEAKAKLDHVLEDIENEPLPTEFLRTHPTGQHRVRDLLFWLPIAMDTREDAGCSQIKEVYAKAMNDDERRMAARMAA